MGEEQTTSTLVPKGNIRTGIQRILFRNSRSGWSMAPSTLGQGEAPERARPAPRGQVRYDRRADGIREGATLVVQGSAWASWWW